MKINHSEGNHSIPVNTDVNRGHENPFSGAISHNDPMIIWDEKPNRRKKDNTPFGALGTNRDLPSRPRD